MLREIMYSSDHQRKKVSQRKIYMKKYFKYCYSASSRSFLQRRFFFSILELNQIYPALTSASFQLFYHWMQDVSSMFISLQVQCYWFLFCFVFNDIFFFIESEIISHLSFKSLRYFSNHSNGLRLWNCCLQNQNTNLETKNSFSTILKTKLKIEVVDRMHALKTTLMFTKVAFYFLSLLLLTGLYFYQ